MTVSTGVLKSVFLGLVVFSSSAGFAQSFHLASSENPAIQCSAIAKASANPQMRQILKQVNGAGLLYRCRYLSTNLQTLLVSMALKNPESPAGKTMTIKCTSGNPFGSYVYRASVGFRPSSYQAVLRFENASGGTSCSIVSAATVQGLNSLEAQTKLIPQMMIMPAAGMPAGNQ